MVVTILLIGGGSGVSKIGAGKPIGHGVDSYSKSPLISPSAGGKGIREFKAGSELGRVTA
jgi:hypothetical protein